MDVVVSYKDFNSISIGQNRKLYFMVLDVEEHLLNYRQEKINLIIYGKVKMQRFQTYIKNIPDFKRICCNKVQEERFRRILNQRYMRSTCIYYYRMSLKSGFLIFLKNVK